MIAPPPLPPTNPYAPPVAEPPAPPRPLYNVGHIVLATFLGSPLAGAILMALNYRRLNPPLMVVTLLLGALATVVVMAIAFVVPDNFPNMVIPGAYTGGMAAVASATQGQAIKQAAAAGEAKASGWRAAGVGVATIVPVLVLTLGVAMLLPEDKVTFGPDHEQEIYLEGGATEQDARKLDSALREAGFFGDQPASVYLKKEQSGWLVTVVLVDGAWDEPDTVAFFRELADELTATLGSGRVRIALANEYLMVKKTL